jgi:hypothetical protein
MPKVQVKKESDLSAEESYSKICELLDADEDLRRLDPNYSCEFDKGNLSGNVTSKQFKAKLHVTEKDSGSCVEVIVDLPFHLALIKGTIASTLDKKLSKVLSS